MTEPDTNRITDEIAYVVNRVYPKFSRFVDKNDLHQELYLYALDRGAKHIERWREKGEKHRIYLALFGAARQYCEREKALQSGYDFDDIAWYSPEKLRDLIPLATDPNFDGITGEAEDANTEGSRQVAGREGGTLLAMIADIRTALRACPQARHVVESTSEDSDEFEAALIVLADFLGGEFPESPAYARGRRQVLSNAAAQALTREAS